MESPGRRRRGLRGRNSDPEAQRLPTAGVRGAVKGMFQGMGRTQRSVQGWGPTSEGTGTATLAVFPAAVVWEEEGVPVERFDFVVRGDRREGGGRGLLYPPLTVLHFFDALMWVSTEFLSGNQHRSWAGTNMTAVTPGPLPENALPMTLPGQPARCTSHSGLGIRDTALGHAQQMNSFASRELGILILS